MAPLRAYASLFPNTVLDVDLWKRFMEDEEITADVPPPVKESPAMASEESVILTGEDQEEAIVWCIDHSLQTILHDILLDIHQEEKVARMKTAVVEVEQKKPDEAAEDEPVETDAAVLQDGEVHLKGNPMKTVKHIRCPDCRLRRLLYPRVGFNARPVPDPNEQYCKTEPMIIIDKHDVHGQRRKGVKVKGQAKGKNKKKNEPASPASENSDPLTPASGPNESFEFKEIDFPAAKCPNRESHLGDHWKSVNVFATHLNGSCYLKKDRAAGREANAKIGGTPRDSRANSPKPTTNGVKRKADDDSPGTTKKKQKMGDMKKEKKGASGPSKLRETENADDQGEESPLKDSAGDTIQVTPTKAARDASNEPSLKLKLKAGGDGTARKKPSKKKA
ncbi:hypothetical protein LTR10_015164 [Elasticomyces elasticus]|uniref:Uncharacterized protein n=1 Tax=Exophiala sideris TaxID=1016849 RepID=A0ABR0JFQ0_9EURO|nr:hypothetical protein LTR10_015164 [Elasticomyces elasticus]KAK5032637.1 hypothetical protein LTS07_004047 [Exophiala sideris]KAK5037182.1 hypothetical protein LTR13_004987 [Exophiala sideris]KAK5062162.1 hypothetical protein LTR69_004520 [Exophiala sideris]KAK5182340.1 hypothetical protein LTR44_005351 [Eurotiomycetes sp. CCFEE 6388]